MDHVPLIQRITDLRRGVELALMFRNRSSWDYRNKVRWKDITGEWEVSEKVFARHMERSLAATGPIEASNSVSRATSQKESQDSP